MALLQRIVLIAGVVAALAVTFIWPPKIIIGTNGIRVPLILECGTRPQQLGKFAEAAGLRTDYEANLERYNRCIQHGSIDTALLAVYLSVILIATGTLAYLARAEQL